MHWEIMDSVGEFWLEGDPGRIHVGAESGISRGSFLNTAGGEIFMGAHVFFGPWVQLLTGAHDYTKFGHERMHSTYQGRNCDITLHDGVWIAGGAIVVGPCEIGAHSVVSAGAVVTGTFPEYALIAGNPAKQIKDVRWPDDPWPPTS